MRLMSGFAGLLLGASCKSAPEPNPLQSFQSEPAGRESPETLRSEPGTIAIISARFGNDCGAPAAELTALFSQTCDGKWRCDFRADAQLLARHAAIGKAAEEQPTQMCLSRYPRYMVEWTCDGSTGRHSLKAGLGGRLRLSCPRPDEQSNEAFSSLAVPPESKPVATTTSAANSPSRDPAIHGRFLGSLANGVADIRVVVGSQRTATDQSGNFSLKQVPATYDLAVVERDEAWVSLYLGLTRRDPVVAHSELPPRPRYSFDHGASISGRFWGEPFTEKMGRCLLSMSFLPTAPTVRTGQHEHNYADNMSFGPNRISWSGPPTLSGRLLATIASNCPGAGCALVGVASKVLRLEDGDTVSEDLHVSELPMGHIAGTWDPTEKPLAESLRFSYELSDGSGSFWVGSCPLRDSADCVLPPDDVSTHSDDPHPCQSFDCPLPDMRSLPGRYCVTRVSKDYPFEGSERLIKCGVLLGSTDLAISGNSTASLDTKAAVRVPAMQVTSPAKNGHITSDSMFTWEAREKSIYVVELRPSVPFNLVPRIFVFTGKTGFRWNDLSAHGIGFPAGANYLVTVTPIPVSSVDQLASFDWWYGRVPDLEQNDPKGLGVTLMDPTTPMPDPAAPSNVNDLKNFPSGLPVCRAPIKGQVLDGHALGRRVSITGKLQHNVHGCLVGEGMNCDYVWQITGVAGSSLPITLGYAPSPRGKMPELAIPVAANGLLVLVPHLGGPVLEQANLCLIRDPP